MLVILFGRSGSGKTKLADYLTENYNIKKIVSATTKEKEDSDGDYIYMEREEFKPVHMAESAEIEGNLYGIPFSEITKAKEGYALAVVDWQGVNNLSIYDYDTKIIKMDAEFSDLIDNYLDRGMTFDDGLKVINNEIMYDLTEADLTLHNDMIVTMRELSEEVLNTINFYKGEK